MKSHDTFLELAAIAMDFPLASADRGRLEQHLAGCSACGRTAHAYRADNLALSNLPAVTLPERRGAEILAAALHPPVVRNPVRILVIVALLGLMLLGSLAVGAELIRRFDDGDLSIVLPVPSQTASPDASARPTAIPAPSSSAVPGHGRMVVTEVVGDTDWIALVGLDDSVTQLAEGRDPAWLSADRIVYFCSQPSPDFRGICTVSPGSPGSVQSLMAEADRPAPAPDGRSIAFHRGAVDVGETWIMAADGTGSRQLALGDFRQWSPDGAWLVGQPESATFQVAIVRVDGTGFRVLAPGYDPVWSPAGTKIAYALVEDQGASLRTVDVATGEVETRYVAPAGAELTAPAWLADDRLVFVQDGDLWRLDTGSTTPVRLSTGLAISTAVPGNPLEVSADGSWIAYTGGTGVGAEVGIASVESDTQIALTWTGPVTQPQWEPQPAPDPDTSPASPAPEGPGTDKPMGATWDTAQVPVVVGRPVGRIEAVTAGGPGFVAVGRGCLADADACELVVWTSIDGKAWQRVPTSDALGTEMVIPTSGPELGMFDVAGGGPGVVAVGYAARPQMEATAWFSPDGVTWERFSFGNADSMRVHAVTWDGRQFVAVGEDRGKLTDRKQLATAKARAAVWTSRDGRTWSRVPHSAALDVGGFIDTMEDPATGGMRDVMGGSYGLVAVGSVCSNKPVGCKPASWTSVDGTTWERGDGMPAISGLLKAVAGFGTRFTAVGAGTCDSSPVAIQQPCPALVLTSPNGRTWTQQPFEQQGDLRALAVIGGRYFATAPDGPETLWTSDDGSVWAPGDVKGGPATAGLGNFAEWHFAATSDMAVWIGTDPETNNPIAWVSVGQ